MERHGKQLQVKKIYNLAKLKAVKIALRKNNAPTSEISQELIRAVTEDNAQILSKLIHKTGQLYGKLLQQEGVVANTIELDNDAYRDNIPLRVSCLPIVDETNNGRIFNRSMLVPPLGGYGTMEHSSNACDEVYYLRNSPEIIEIPSDRQSDSENELMELAPTQSHTHSEQNV